MISRTIFVVSFILSVQLLANSAMAISCFEESPRLKAMGEDAYYTVNESILEPKSKEQTDFLEGLYGEWNYTIEERVCSQSNGEPKNDVQEAIGKVVFSKTKLSDLNAQLAKDYKTISKEKTEKIDLLPIEFIASLFVSEKELQASARYWKFRVFHERILKINKSSKRIQIELVEFLAGTFSSSRTITLDVK